MGIRSRLCEETGRNRRTAEGSGPSVTRYYRMGPTLKMCPSSSTPYSGDGHRKWGPSAKLPQTEGNVPTAHNVTIPIVFPLHLPIMHGSLPIGIDGVGKRELEPESTKRGIAEVNLRIVALNPGLI